MRKFFKSSKPVIFKSHFGNYDNICNFKCSTKFNYLIFTDLDINLKGWITIKLTLTEDPVKNNRLIKLEPWKYFDAPYSVYLDSRIAISQDCHDLIENISSTHDFIVLTHRNKDRVINEFTRNLNNFRITENEINNFLKLDNKYLLNSAVECGFIIRNHFPINVREHGSRWFNRFCQIRRDQLCIYDDHTANLIHVLDLDFNNKKYFSFKGKIKRKLSSLFKRYIIILKILFGSKIF